MSIDTVIGLYEGFHFEGEIRALNRIAASVTDGVIVAIGSYRGQMDCALALHAQVPVYAIDSRESGVEEEFVFSDADRAHWMRNVLALGVAEKIRPINLRSADAAYAWQRMDAPVGLLYVDGSHDYQSVYDDLLLWLYYVLPDGIVAVHDNNLPGVAQALAKFDYCLEMIEQADLTNVYRLVKPYQETAPIDANEIAITIGESVFGQGIATVSLTDYAVGESDHVAVKAKPPHPSQKPKTPPKKVTKRK